jgi:hypothetical protein
MEKQPLEEGCNAFDRDLTVLLFYGFYGYRVQWNLIEL